MESVSSPETSVMFYQIIHRHVSKDGTVLSYRCDNLNAIPAGLENSLIINMYDYYVP
jgi:hypothetical protein